MTERKAGDKTVCNCGADVMFLRYRATERLIAVNLKPTDKRFRPARDGELHYLYGQHQSHVGTCAAGTGPSFRETRASRSHRSPRTPDDGPKRAA
jgi:hypothetical protein